MYQEVHFCLESSTVKNICLYRATNGPGGPGCQRDMADTKAKKKKGGEILCKGSAYLM